MRPAELLRERSLSPDQVATLLAEQGITLTKGDRKGSTITGADVSRRVRSGDFPRAWWRALGEDEDQDLGARAASDGSGGAREPADLPPLGRAHEKPPQRPAGAKVEPVVVPAGSGKRIAGLYRGGGAILAMQVRRTHGENAGQGVAKVFSDKADPIAELWLQAAAENPAVARFVNTINGGGVTGDLVLAHVVLAASLIYILGAPLPDAAFANYSRYRVVVEQPVAEPEPDPADLATEPGVNGSARSTSTAPLG